MKSRKRASARAIGGCTLCSSARAGAAAVTWSIACTAKKAWCYAEGDRAAAKTAVNRAARHRVQGRNEAWGLDFVHDQLNNGQSFRALTIIDLYRREA
jgi:hypothetical protein